MQVVYNSFGGRYSDSPRAIHHALLERGDAIEHVWLCHAEHAAWFPADTVTVPASSQAAVDALESADLIVTNSHLDHLDWRKCPGTTYVQTWHGTPLKRIHGDVLWKVPGLLERLSLDVDRWNVLLTPNAFSTAALRQAFRWQGEVLEIGYPRNDVLLSPDAPDIRDRVRADLGIHDSQKVVLYTPTWRDDEFFGGSERATLALDIERFESALGDDHVLLVRAHYKLTGRLRAGDYPSVRDVSFHPEISDLYLAADLMITDYSSTMFDFAVTGKPLLFYTYDLTRYRDELRGFYFDLSDEAPGPLVETTEDLVQHIGEIKAVSEQYADHYARFRERFCHLDDGRATQRFLARFFPERADDRFSSAMMR